MNILEAHHETIKELTEFPPTDLVALRILMVDISNSLAFIASKINEMTKGEIK